MSCMSCRMHLLVNLNCCSCLLQIKCIVKQLFRGLALLQHKKILHRDLKNSNLLLNNKARLGIIGPFHPHKLRSDAGIAAVYCLQEATMSGQAFHRSAGMHC